jgi:hypothetical protein
VARGPERVAAPARPARRLIARPGIRRVRGVAVVALARKVEAEAEVDAEWTAHLGHEATEQLRAALERLREITDPYA